MTTAMNETDVGHAVPDAKSSRLRAAIAAIERELARLPPNLTNDIGPTPADGLRASVDDLAHPMALGPEPEYRHCPVCRQVGMRAATVCGHCWTKLKPLAALAGV